MNRLVAETSTCDDTNQPELIYNSEYSYDLTGNRKNYSVTNDSVTTAVSYTYNANDQLIDETKSVTDESDVVTHYEYDTNGSLISKISTESSYTYSYNLQNRLSTAIINRTEGGTTVALTTDYTYNQSGIRVRAKSTPSGSSLTTEKAYLIDAGLTGYAQVLEEKEVNADNSTTLIKSYTLGDDVISQTSIHNSSFVIHNLLYDGHGSTRLLTDTNGTIAETYNYDAYGKNLFDTSNTETNLLYSGEQFDNSLQMQYLRARYYDQNTGGFNRLDPFNGNMGDPQSLHKYAYCHGDPVNGIDPSGRMTLTGKICVVGIILILSGLVIREIISSYNTARYGQKYDEVRLYVTPNSIFDFNEIENFIENNIGIPVELYYTNAPKKLSDNIRIINFSDNVELNCYAQKEQKYMGSRYYNIKYDLNKIKELAEDYKTVNDNESINETQRQNLYFNIATHEIFHALGAKHLYGSENVENLMYHKVRYSENNPDTPDREIEGSLRNFLITGRLNVSEHTRNVVRSRFDGAFLDQ